MKRSLFAAVSLLSLARVASAADLPTRKEQAPPPSPPLVWNWTGFYTGLDLGVGWGGASVSATNSRTGAFIGTASRNSSANFLGGGQVAFRYQTASNLVFGVQSQLQFGEEKSKTFGGYTLSTTERIGGNVALQAGYSFGDVLPYALGGLALSSANLNLTDPNNITTSSKIFAGGWLIGAGLDYHVFGNWVLTTQYHYSWLDYNNTFPVVGVYTTSRLQEQAVLFGAAYKF
jgi:outer membrane immunogenic protein